MKKEEISSEELKFLVRRNKEMQLSELMTLDLTHKVQEIFRKSLKNIEQYVKQTLDKPVAIHLVNYQMANGTELLETIFEDELIVCSFRLAGDLGKQLLLANKTQLEYFNEKILSDTNNEDIINSLSNGLTVFYQSFYELLNLDKQVEIENIEILHWSTKDNAQSLELDALYELKKYAVEYENQELSIIHLSEVESMENLYGNLSDKMSEQQATEGNEQMSQSNAQIKRPLFCEFDEIDTPNANHNLGLLYDVPLEITVVLGKTRRSIKDILEINTGKIIELNKYADDPLEIYCNGKLIAEGEVVVVDDNFGIKVTKLHQAAMHNIK